MELFKEKEMTKLELQSILNLHALWVICDPKGIRADLSGADFSGANLSGANLSETNLSKANLFNADLSGANLSRADLSGANLSMANLSQADLSVASLSGASLSRANLSGANLSWADLSRANLSRANLSRANLFRANLLIFQFNKHFAYYTYNDSIKIGCHYASIKEWLRDYKEVGKSEGYTDLQIKLYGQFIKNCDLIHRKYLGSL